MTMPAGTAFVAFADLTEEIVLGWIKSVVVVARNHLFFLSGWLGFFLAS